ncbi:MAG TPA: DUF3187 family protein [Fimbriimonadaceae bacterium]|nr:DUF3187 family protein [Fimbriimonadaceae bacterium]
MKRSVGAILGLFSLAGTLYADDPIPIRNGRAITLPYLRLTPRTDVGELGRRRSFASIAIANDYRLTDRSIEDVELYRFEFGAREPFAGGDLEWTAALQAFGGGFLDPIIDGWHAGVLRWSHPERDRAAFGRTRIEIDGHRQSLGAGLGDLKLQWNRNWNERVLSLAVELPTGNARKLTGSGELEAGVGVGFPVWERGRWEASLHLAAIWQFGRSELARVRSIVDQETVSARYRIRDGESWHIQWHSEASAHRTGIPVSDAAHRIWGFGWRKRFDSGESIEIYFTEDRDLFTGGFPALADVGPDFAIGFRWFVVR